MKDYYYILGVSQHATQDEIKSSFRAKAKLYHPDVNKSPGAHESFIGIGEAYEILSNPSFRMEYDNLIRANASNQSQNQNTSSNFHSYQEAAYKKAQHYSDISLDEVLSSIIKFTYELGRAALLGERDKPKITFGDYIRMGFYGILLTICIIISFTGVGTIPGVIIGLGILHGMKKDGKLIGIGPLLISTIVADLIVVFALYSLISYMFY